MRVKKLLKILAYGLVAFVVFLLLLAGVSQTQVFRDGLRAFALSRLNDFLDADVQLGTITGNLISGFSVDHISIKVDHEYFVVAERLDLRYDLFEVPGKKISVDNLTLVRPQIALLRGRDSVWNFTRMVKVTAEDTTTGGPFLWKIHVKHFKIEDGTFVLVDSASLTEPDHSPPDPYFVEYHDLALKKISLEATIDFSREEKHIDIFSFCFESDTPALSLKTLKGDFSVTSTGVRAKGMVLQTGLSNLQLDAEMRDINLFGGLELPELEKKPVRLSLHAHEIDLNELKRFIPQIAFLGSHVSLDLEAKGEFGELEVASLLLKSGETELHMTGGIFNLYEPRNIYLNAKFNRSIVRSRDVLAILPEFDLPDLEKLGRSRLNLSFVGRPLDFQTQVDLETDGGTVQADLGLKIGGSSRLQYKGQARYHGLDLAAISASSSLKSHLNGSVRIEGRGITLDNLLATTDLDLDSSVLAGRSIGGTRLRVEAAERRLSGKGTLNIGSMYATVNAVLDESVKGDPPFTVDADVTGMDLEQILQDPAAGSNLNFDIVAHGSGLTWGTLNGEFRMNFRPSIYREYRIDSSQVLLVFDQHNPTEKQLTVNSNIADFSLSGAFDTEYMKDLIYYEALNLRKAVGEKFVSLDSSIGANIDPAALAALEEKLSARKAKLDLSFSLHVKDLEPVSIATSNRSFNGFGVLSGSMQGDFQNLSIDTRLTVGDFFYGNADSGVLIHDGSATLSVANLKPRAPLREISTRFGVQAGKLHVNRDELDSVRIGFKYEQEYSSYTVQSMYNRDTRVNFQGFSNITGDYLDFTLNSFQIAFRDFAWRADGGSVIGFGPRGIRVENLTMRRDTQMVTLSGSIIKGASLTGSLSARKINLEDLRYLLRSEEAGASQTSFTGFGNVDVKARGTLEDPAYSATVEANAVSFRGVPLGNVKGAFSYAGQSLSADVEIVSAHPLASKLPYLTVLGVVPVNLALAQTEDVHREMPMRLSVRSEGVDIGILDPILPTFNQLTGVMKCQVDVTGSPDAPNYSGALSIESCSFLFVPNLIYYKFDGRFRFAGERVEVVDAVVASDPVDDQFKRAGLIRLSGDFALRDFRPSDFNLTATGGLLVVRESTRKSSLSVSGNLFVETGPGGIHYTGETGQSLLTGLVLVNNSSLIFPPTQQVANEELSDTVPVRVLDDTTKTTVQQTRPLAERYFGSDGESALRNRVQIEQGPSKSFVDGIRYDLDIECTGGNAEIKMIFNSATNEELDANINGKFSITEDGKRWIGTMSIERAYYRFIKVFNAEGTITYSGDFLNPALDIIATYEGMRAGTDSTSSNKPEKVVVSMKITGTRNAPKLVFSMTIDDVDYLSYKGAKSADVQTDALAFILAGNFPLSKSQANDLADDLRPTARSSLITGASSLITNAFSDFLRRETGFIYSVELSYGTQASVSQAADIRLSGVAAGGIWRYGGRILNDPFNNANVSLLYSFGDIFDRPSLRNFMFELERKVELNTIGDATDKRLTNSARIFYRFSF